jgi:hypothetical protein
MYPKMIVNGTKKKNVFARKKRRGIWQERLDLRSEIGSGNKISSHFIRKKENVAVLS